MSEGAYAAGIGSPAATYTVAPRTLRGVTTVLLFALGVEVFFAALSIAAYALRLHVIGLLESGGPLTRSTVALSNDFLKWISRLSIPMVIVVLVVLMVWVHQARKNLEDSRSGPFHYSPAMAVGSFFIPFVNLVLPYLVVREIWSGSDPAIPPEYPMPFVRLRTSPFVVLWWVAYLASNWFAWLVTEAGIIGRDSVTLSSLRRNAELSIAGHLLQLGSVALTAVLAYRVMRREDALQRQVPRPAPPPPPLAGPANAGLAAMRRGDATPDPDWRELRAPSARTGSISAC
jgi:Domain of unknown function (DUF4328)